MSHMFHEYFGAFGRSPALLMPIVALVIFITIFGIAAARIWRRGAAAFEAHARLPLADDGHEEVCHERE